MSNIDSRRCVKQRRRQLMALAGMGADQKGNAAVATLESHGFTWSGGQFWKPPLGLPPAYVSNERAELENYRNAQQVVPDVLERLLSIVSDPRALPRRKEWISGQQYSYVLLENVEGMVNEACCAAMQSGAVKDGWVMVPEEPTHEMLEAGDEQFGTYDVYRRMLAAAPQQEADNG
ncbi:hypothetical protein [Escherichia coli]|uniref:hypothetical protein n=1 Tax=Escherichia coli TaxID=562 RepID=UPI003CE5148A